MRKNIFAAVLIAACLVFSPGKSCAEDTSEVRLFNDLLGYIYTTEIICSDIQWVIDYFESFDRERNWENLQLARAALAIAKSDIGRHRLPKPEMTADDYRVFMKRKIDVSFMESLEYAFKAAQTTILNDCINLNNSLMLEVFLKDCWEIGVRNAAGIRKFAEYEISSLANMADYALTSLNDSEITAKFSTLMEKHYPQTRARQRKKPESLKEIEASIAKLHEELKETLAEDSKLIGEATHSLNVMKDAADKEDWKPIRKNIMKIKDMPPAVLMPLWLVKADIHYFWKGNDGMTIPPACAKLEGLSASCYMRVDAISLEQVKAWQDELKRGGLPCRRSGEKDNKYCILYQAESSKFSVIWENSKVVIQMSENPVIFMPKLYLSFLPDME